MGENVRGLIRGFQHGAFLRSMPAARAVNALNTKDLLLDTPELSNAQIQISRETPRMSLVPRCSDIVRSCWEFF